MLTLVHSWARKRWRERPMIRRSFSVPRGFAACLVLFVGLASAPAILAAVKEKKADPSDQFFADTAIRVFQIEISQADFSSLSRRPRVYVTGTVREGSRVLTNVGIHLKGMGSFRTIDEKPSFVLKFDQFAPDQEYCGLTKLMLNNSVQDQTYLSELLATGLFRDAGVPAARVTHTKVTLNGH